MDERGASLDNETSLRSDSPTSEPTDGASSDSIAESSNGNVGVLNREQSSGQSPFIRTGTSEKVRRNGRRFPMRFSPLTIRILVMNILVLLIPVFGLFWADQYFDSLVEAEMQSLQREGRIIAVAIAAGAVFTNQAGQNQLVQSRADRLIHLLSAESKTRVRLFRTNGQMVSDSLALKNPGGIVNVQPIGESQTRLPSWATWVWNKVVTPAQDNLPLYEELANQQADHYRETSRAFFGESGRAIRADEAGDLVLSVGIPVTRYRNVLGALMLSRDKTGINQSVRNIRITILQVFLIALALTVLFSLFLASTIVRPIIELAKSAEQVRSSKAHQYRIPDFSNRRDEIGDLSVALREMTEALWQRIDAIESFAADVSHEIKNPLTSIKSALETSQFISDPAKKEQLLDIAFGDIERLDRLITDISDASRLDAELSRGQSEIVDVGELLETLKLGNNMTRGEDDPEIVYKSESHAPGQNVFFVNGIEGRLGQVFRNLINNAKSFSPPKGKIFVNLIVQSNGRLIATVEDQGPGLPPDKLDAVFNRFYTDRPEGSFGNHSGLGLSISKQIIEAHGGQLRANNAIDSNGEITGALFSIELPRQGIDHLKDRKS